MRRSLKLVLTLAFVAASLGSAEVARAQFSPDTTGQLPIISISDATVTFETDRGTGEVAFTISISPAPTIAASVILSTRDVTASSPVDRQHCGPPFDYLRHTNVRVTFFPGDSAVIFQVAFCGDGADEDDETFEVNLFDPTFAVIGDGQGIGTIIDDDDAPLVSIADAAIREGDSGTSNLEFTVELSGASGKQVSVVGTTSNSTATGGTTCTPADFLEANNTVTFLPGETSKVFTVPVCGDTVFEPNEDFFVTLSNPSNATIHPLRQRATGIIRKDDGKK